jgi:hypothetical protein
MKKLLGILVLGLLWCNVGFAEEKRNQINSKLGFKYDISLKLLSSSITAEQLKEIAEETGKSSETFDFEEWNKNIEAMQSNANIEGLIPIDDNDDTVFNILKNPLSKDILFDSNNLKSWCDLIEQQNGQVLDGFSLEECILSNIPNQGSSIFWKSNIVKAEESRLITYLNIYKKTQYQITMGCDIKNCNKWIPELEKIASSFKAD